MPFYWKHGKVTGVDKGSGDIKGRGSFAWTTALWVGGGIMPYQVGGVEGGQDLDAPCRNRKLLGLPRRSRWSSGPISKARCQNERVHGYLVVLAGCAFLRSCPENLNHHPAVVLAFWNRWAHQTGSASPSNQPKFRQESHTFPPQNSNNEESS